jgi:Toprim-like
MKPDSLSFSEAKKFPIVDYLTVLGIEPAKIRGTDYWYHSPFRDERTASFKVNTKSNVWFDHGTGSGGTLLDLGAALHQCTLSEFLMKLSEGNHGLSPHQPLSTPIAPENKLEVLSAGTLSNPDLIYYLKKRGIDQDTANQHCKEVEFRIGTRSYSAIGFPNNSGAYELRNNWFKGSSSPKDVLFINKQSSKLCVLEGFMDFLSLQRINNPELKLLATDSNFLVLNSLSLLNRSIPIIKSHDSVSLFLDNDRAATDAKMKLTENGMSFRDAGPLYGKHKDLNEYLISELRSKKDIDRPLTRSRGFRR